MSAFDQIYASLQSIELTSHEAQILIGRLITRVRRLGDESTARRDDARLFAIAELARQLGK